MQPGIGIGTEKRAYLVLDRLSSKSSPMAEATAKTQSSKPVYFC